MGKLIVIEGVDSSGKETQTNLLFERLKENGEHIIKLSFPDYESEFCAPVKRYLAGDLGKNPEDVNAYAASSFYAIDRYASFKTKWGAFYEEGGTVLCDRYVTSNVIHQAMKIKDAEEKKTFMDWLSDYEYKKLGLPVPDAVIFLDMPPACARMLMANRKNKITGDSEKDIHEKNASYLEEAYENAVGVCEHLGWHRISCAKDGNVRKIEEIHAEIYEIIKQICK